MLHHGIIRKYTLGLLNLFNDLEVQYLNSDNTTTTKKIPCKYSSKEKSHLFDEHTTEQLLSGNTNVLPRSNLALSTMVKSAERTTGKFNKINRNLADKEFMYNPVPYEFTFELTVQCRGMNEASMIIEQVAPKFNHNLTMRINEVPNQVEPTSIPVQLLDISIEQEEYEEISTNIVTIGFGLAIKGNLYPAIRNIDLIEEVDMYVNMWHHSEANDYNRATLYEWDVIDNMMTNQTTTTLVNDAGEFTKIDPVVNDIISVDDVFVGDSIQLVADYRDPDNKIEELTFNWAVTGSATLTSDRDSATLTGVATEVIDVSVSVTDIHGNTSNTFIKQITVI